jgi:hypothetical protein
MSVEFIDKDGSIQEVDSEIDVKTGVDLAREGLRKAGFKIVHTLVHRDSGDVVPIPDEEVGEALKTGKFEIPQATEAKKAYKEELLKDTGRF